MPAVSVNGNTAGGAIVATQAFVRIDGVAIVRVGDPITPHATGAHLSATMAAGSSFVTIEGVPICRQGDPATCGHTASGSGFVTSA